MALVSSAAAPATCGVAMLVPLRCPKVPCGPAEKRGRDAGCRDVGLHLERDGVGPADEKFAIMPRELTAATVIAPGALPGDEIEP